MRKKIKLIGLAILVIICFTKCDEEIIIPNLTKNVHVCIDVATEISNQNSAPRIAVFSENKWETGETLKVKFLGGSEFVQEKVQFYAKQWENYANIQFEFIESGEADIRISFWGGKGSWSIRGKYSRTYSISESNLAAYLSSEGSSMNFGWFDDETTEEVFRRTILHEFGHALAAIHEHQHPQNPIEWNKPIVYNYYANNGWSEEKVDAQVFDRYGEGQTQFSQYDPLSIMHYPIPNEHTLNDFEVGWNTVLSEKDKCFIRKVYPFPDVGNFYASGFGVQGGSGWYLGSFDNDDKVDILRYTNSNGGAEVCLSNGSSFDAPTLWSSAGVKGGDGWYVGHFNNDERDDILRYTNSNGGAEVCLSNGTSFDTPVLWSSAGVKGGRGWYIGDFDGDDMDDILRYTNSNGGAEVCLSNGTSFDAPIPWSSAGVKGGDGWYVGYFNNDKEADILRFSNSNGGAEVCLSNGTSFDAPVLWSSAGVRGGRGWYVGDFDGNGMDDILRYTNSNGGAEVCLSNGSSFDAPTLWCSAGVRGGNGWYVEDFDGDGRDDIFRYINQHGGVEVFLSTGSSFVFGGDC